MKMNSLTLIYVAHSLGRQQTYTSNEGKDFSMTNDETAKGVDIFSFQFKYYQLLKLKITLKSRLSIINDLITLMHSLLKFSST